MTRSITLPGRALGAAAAIMTLAGVASAQSLESRIAAARGSVGFEYVTRPNVCGDGASITVSNDSSPGWTVGTHRSGVHIGTGGGGRYDRCDTGPARVVLRRDGTRVVDVGVSVGAPLHSAGTDLGEVPPAEAASYLLDLAPRLAGRAADHAMIGARIAQGVTVWPRMLKIARDSNASESARKAALFWVSQEASDAATAGLDSIAADDDGSLSVRSDALFYLAQRPDGSGIPALVHVVESSRSMKLRKDAIWFLAQSRDRRALDLFEKLLTGVQSVQQRRP